MTDPHGPTRGISPTTTATEQHPDSESLDYAHWIADLLEVGQGLCGQSQGVCARVCLEVALVTHGRARLVLRPQTGRLDPAKTPAAPNSIPVVFGPRTYGTLHLFPDPSAPCAFASQLVLDHLLADICGWVLHTLELAAFVAQQSRHLNDPPAQHLTIREREVLTLICLGCSQHEAAQRLHIAPTTVAKHLQHIYQKMGVCCERDVVLAAHATGLYSALEVLPG